MGSNVMFVIYGLYIRMFLLPNFNLKKGIVKPVLNDLKPKRGESFGFGGLIGLVSVS